MPNRPAAPARHRLSVRPGSVVALLLPVLVLAGLTGCGGSGDGAEPGRITIVADAYPTAYAAEQVVGDDVDVLLLTQPGVEPHDLELTAEQVRQVADADLVAYIPGLVPAVAQAAQAEAPDRIVDMTAGIDLREGDPHIWLDPMNMATMGRTIAAAVTDKGLAEADDSTLKTAMTALDKDYRERLAACQVRTLIVAHAAFGYLTDAYGFTEEGISGNSPEAEPSPARLKELTGMIRSEGITTIYTEPLATPAAADTLASETGAATAVLDPIEGATGGLTYEQLMRANLNALYAGQDCG
jgi:zinc transport system substrate-binding protein